MQVTTKQLSKKLGLDYLMASSLLKLAVKTGQAKEVGKVHTAENRKGKPSTVFEVPDTLTFNLVAQKETV